MLKFLKNFLIFIILCLLQIYCQGNFFVRPIIDFLLIFLVFSLFDFPLLYLVILIVIRGLIFDTLSGLSWGINLFSLGIAFGAGFLMMYFLERKNFVSQIIIGEVIINVYFISLYLLNIITSHQHLGPIVIFDILINDLLYLGLMFLNRYVQKKQLHRSR